MFHELGTLFERTYISVRKACGGLTSKNRAIDAGDIVVQAKRD